MVVRLIQSNAPTEQTEQERITCAAPINDMRPKLFATLTQEGLYCWCKYHKKAHLISREKCMEFWSRGESVQCQPGQDEPCEDGERPDIAV